MFRVSSFLFLACLAGCGRCSRLGDRAPAQITRWLPASAEAVVVIPDLGALGEKLRVLEGLKLATFLAQLEGMASAQEYLTAVMSQLGVDLRSKEQLEAAGISSSGAAAAALLPDGTAFSVIPVSDSRKLEAAVALLARNRLGAGERSTRQQGERTAILFSKPGGKAELGLLIQDRYAFIAPAEAVANLEAFAALEEKDSLFGNVGLERGLARLPAERHLFAYLPSGSKVASPLSGVVLTAALSAEAFVFRADLPWPNNRSALEVLEPVSGPDLSAYLPSEAFLALLIRSSWVTAKRVSPSR